MMCATMDRKIPPPSAEKSSRALVEEVAPLKVLIAGGGTGGHLFPGIAIAEAFRKRNRDTEILFIGTERGLEKRVLGPLGFRLQTLDVEGIKGRGLRSKFRAVGKLPGSLLAAWRFVRSFSPDLVVGVGGYSSGPVVLAAALLGIPTAIAEQNAVAGTTNRILGRFADRVFLSFRDEANVFSARKSLLTGNPIRSAFLTNEDAREQTDGRFSILIFGGSQGAHAINAAALAALDGLSDIRDGIRIVHQTGEREREEVERTYRAKGFAAEVLPFIADMPAAFRAADLVICRAGATSIAELTASGKAAILIPFPFAVADHQTQNARVLAEAGAAEMVKESDLTGERLAGIIRRHREQPEMRKQMEERARKLGNPGAADDIVKECIALAHGKRSRS
ncbi:MAG TPA: undecaprenyldiphospho-muramoylpentapeptide beta-N-acetylglucosaminyltransferase [Candidatus Ozemobacteraceae bacterium]|nr:undecaprenyldiphospho-muramoylpentapeptide beta-N-acetylglucosaminyltransferase [Candidatus Ozemobacteraceae bacterium]